MAGNAVIGALRVNLSADTAAFEKGLKSAQSSLSSFSKNVATIASGIGLERAFRSVVSGIVQGMKDVFNEADNIGKAAQRIGIPVEELSKLKYAADISDVSMETLEKSVTKLNRSMADALSDTTGKAALQFKGLGIEVRNTDGTIKSVTTVMSEMAGKFSGMADGATKVAASMNLMGRGGTQMIPMLNQGAKAINDLMKEAEDLGAVITTRVANSADRMSDDFKRLTTVNKAVSNSIIQELAPAMGVLVDEFIEWLKEGKKVSDIGVTLVNGFYSIAEVAMIVTANIRSMTTFLGALADQAKAFFSLDFAGVSAAQKVMDSTGEALAMRLAENAVWLATVKAKAAELREELGKGRTGARDYGNEIGKKTNALDAYFKSLEKSIAGQRAEAQTVGLLAGSKESLKVILQGEAIARENNIRLTDVQRERLAALAGEARNAALVLAGAQLTEESLLPWQKYEKQLRTINELLQAQAITAETAGLASRAAAEKAGATWEQVTANAAGGFAALANEMGKSSTKMATVGKALAIVEATINTYVAFTKALASIPPPLNYIAAAGVLAAGMAKVLAIKSQSIPKMNTGGTLIPKQFNGPDSVLMQARIRPDEEVDIIRPGEQRRGQGGGTVSITLIGDNYSRSGVEKLIDSLNDVLVDRGAPKLATV